MVTALAPYAIILGVAATAALVFMNTWEKLLGVLGPLADRYTSDLASAQLRIGRDELLLGMLAFSAIAWTAFLVLVHPSLLVAALMLPATLGIVFYVFGKFLRRRIQKRLDAFNGQLELVLRLLSSGLRAGLSLRQAFVLVIDELADPAKSEFRRVVSQTNVGVSVSDALDALVVRMPSEELGMMVRAIKVQSQTGGNLGKILDHLASTIKDRRQIYRKVKALTAEGVASGWVIGALPVLVGAFIMVSQQHMRDSTLNTNIGHISMFIFAALEGAGIMIVMKIVKIDV